MIKKFYVTDIVVPNINAFQLVETFIISAVSSILIIRVFLKIMGYPQLGGGELHIAHMLWGGLLMVLALFLLFNFIDKTVRSVSSLVGGIGFGMFIDEIGKFVTADNDYFFEPAIALIYVIFVAIFLLYKLINSHLKYSEKTYVVNAAEALAEIVGDSLGLEGRSRALGYLNNCPPEDPIIIDLKKLISGAVSKEKPDSLRQQLKKRLVHIHQRAVRSHRVSRLLIFFSILSSSVHVILSITLFIKIGALNFEQVGYIVSSLISGLILLVGIYYFIKGIYHTSLEMLLYATLVQIFLTQFFLFWDNQLMAIGTLCFNLLIYQIVKFKLEGLPISAE
jgi:hypothetical protein